MKFSQTKDGVTFGVWVVPRGRRNEIIGVHGDSLKIRVAAPPVEGRANDEVIAFLAAALGVSRQQIEIVSGHTARWKRVWVRGLTSEDVRSRLLD